MKAFATEICSNGVEVCRKACGGHGYSLYSGLPSLYTKVTASCTYEGENTVLHLQVARFLVKCFAAAQSGTPLPTSTAYLSSPSASGCQATTPVDFLNPEVYLKAYECRAYRLTASAARKLQNLVQSGLLWYMGAEDPPHRLSQTAQHSSKRLSSTCGIELLHFAGLETALHNISCPMTFDVSVCHCMNLKKYVVEGKYAKGLNLVISQCLEMK
ncbi:hypothetical protein GDO78_022998 [Eleutherodactylus coqui]|uniref:Acyl-CoA oxidase C-alpha1 domain-containing protein n=1 Tax=Eleutherodactylus coqui TaxID=57060 RepID=A0A8J6B7P5_ELECQ|nr:hypothetical protein GDO78_022998 [Eleutherodactylus coqui]